VSDMASSPLAPKFAYRYRLYRYAAAVDVWPIEEVGAAMVELVVILHAATHMRLPGERSRHPLAHSLHTSEQPEYRQTHRTHREIRASITCSTPRLKPWERAMAAAKYG